jgi:phospholipid/cholesterol/gamma-HCH transport system permease protein
MDLIQKNVMKLGLFAIFSKDCIAASFKKPIRVKRILLEIYHIGFQSLSIILFTGFFTGMVLGLQGYETLKRFASEGLLGAGVVYSLLAELGPVLTALLCIGRAGSSICAELGSMRQGEQIEALQCMGIEVYNYLLAPKLIAALITLPLLVLLFCQAGILGGYFTAVSLLGVYGPSFFQSMQSTMGWELLRMSLVKGLSFGLILVLIASFAGFKIHKFPTLQGAIGLSRATTSAVVISSVLVLGFDYIITFILL